jgi:hypothetical protein
MFDMFIAQIAINTASAIAEMEAREKVAADMKRARDATDMERGSLIDGECEEVRPTLLLPASVVEATGNA